MRVSTSEAACSSLTAAPPWFRGDRERGGGGLTFLFRGMGSSKSRLLASASSMPSSGAGLRKGLALSADSGGDGVDGLDWSLGALQLQ